MLHNKMGAEIRKAVAKLVNLDVTYQGLIIYRKKGKEDSFSFL